MWLRIASATRYKLFSVVTHKMRPKYRRTAHSSATKRRHRSHRPPGLQAPLGLHRKSSNSAPGVDGGTWRAKIIWRVIRLSGPIKRRLSNVLRTPLAAFVVINLQYYNLLHDLRLLKSSSSWAPFGLRLLQFLASMLCDKLVLLTTWWWGLKRHPSEAGDLVLL